MLGHAHLADRFASHRSSRLACPTSRDHLARRNPNETVHEGAWNHRASRRRDSWIGHSPAGAIAGGALFRPELLWVSARVNESFPPAASPMTAGSPAPTAGVLATGSFHSVAHKSMGSAAVHRLPPGGRRLA